MIVKLEKGLCGSEEERGSKRDRAATGREGRSEVLCLSGGPPLWLGDGCASGIPHNSAVAYAADLPPSTFSLGTSAPRLAAEGTHSDHIF